MEAAFWQRLLAAELHPRKGRALARALGPLASGADRLLDSPSLTPNERQRARAADLEALGRALERGVELVETESLCPAAQDSIPPAIMLWGDRACLDAPTIGIVGTRAASTYGRAAAHKFAESFARAGVTVVSGGALGIDAAAHKGALAGGGKTAAVLASGIDRVYPAVHGGLFTQIRGQGCLVSQFAAGLLPTPYRFLLRNQLVAALSRALVVIEAPERSGALSTAHAANDLGLQVFVVPANIDNLNYRGSHALVRDGATLADHPDLVLEALGIAPQHPHAPDTPVTELQQRILDALDETPRSAEHIVERSGLDASEAMAEITMLELAGKILREQGGYAKKP